MERKTETICLCSKKKICKKKKGELKLCGHCVKKKKKIMDEVVNLFAILNYS